jgi:hypothetical protein
MKRWCCACLLFCVIAPPARAHFVWIVPDQAGALLIFSDTLQPDAKVPVTKIAATEVFVGGAGGKFEPLKATLAKDAYRVELPARGRPVVLGALCRYGVVQKGKADPFLLLYCARALVGAMLQDSPEEFWQPAERLPLNVILIEGKLQARVLWQGKPLADAEVAVLAPGAAQPAEGKTDKDGVIALGRPTIPGVYAIRARHVEAKEGEEGGKKYKEVRYYSTLTFPVRPAAGKEGAERGQSTNIKSLVFIGPERIEGDQQLRSGRRFSVLVPESETHAASAQPAKADPEATRLLREARAARVSWAGFPGFSADLEYNHNGKVVRGRVEVSAEGKVKVDLPDGEARKWANGQLRSLVAHRMDNSADLNTPCAFLDDNPHHPLGRAIRVLNDELHSSYRIRDRQIIEVNRKMKDSRFTITVLHNYVTPEKKYLPASYVVNTWTAGHGKGQGESLTSSTSFHQTWQRVSKFDLPTTVLVVTAAGTSPDHAGAAKGDGPRGTIDARSLTLSNHQLLPWR